MTKMDDDIVCCHWPCGLVFLNRKQGGQRSFWESLSLFRTGPKNSGEVLQRSRWQTRQSIGERGPSLMRICNILAVYGR